LNSHFGVNSKADQSFLMIELELRRLEPVEYLAIGCRLYVHFGRCNNDLNQMNDLHKLNLILVLTFEVLLGASLNLSYHTSLNSEKFQKLPFQAEIVIC